MVTILQLVRQDGKVQYVVGTAVEENGMRRVTNLRTIGDWRETTDDPKNFRTY